MMVMKCQCLLLCLLCIPVCSVKRKLSDLQPKSTSNSVSRSANQHSSTGSSHVTGQTESVRAVLQDIFVSNKLSALDTFRIASSSVQAGAAGITDFASVGNFGAAPQNLARDLLRKMLKGCDCPELFYWPIPVWNSDTSLQQIVQYPFLLPHEMVHRIASQRGVSFFDVTAENYPELLVMKQAFCRALKLPFAETLCLGLHGDGVPYTKSDSLEILSFNFLSFPTANRFPITAISKKYLCHCGCKGRHTWNAILLVFAWSIKMLITGLVSHFLPDGSEWVSDIKHLAAGTRLICRAGLLQCRGDWPFLRTLFSFPSWSSESICWLCKANKTDKSYKDCSTTATWRQNRYGPAEFLQCLRNVGVEINPLFSIPGFQLSYIVLDWLHIVDLGVGADVLGCFFWDLITIPTILPGSNKADRLKALWSAIKAWYGQAKPSSVLDNLTEEMIKNKDKPKLRCKGGECRYLIPFAQFYSQQFAHKNVHWSTIASLFNFLFRLQQYISCVIPFSAEEASKCSRRFCLLYKALQTEASLAGKINLWNMKPKVHLLQELVEYQSFQHGAPRNFWCYRDESWCGWWAKASLRRGGANNAATTATRFLQRFRILDPELV
jgi:hypothetical protein